MRFEEGKFQCTYEEGKFQCTYIIPAGLKAFNLLYSLELQLFQRGLGSPLLAHADLLDYLLDRPHQRFILAAFRPQDLFLYDRDIDHMKVVVVTRPAPARRTWRGCARQRA